MNENETGYSIASELSRELYTPRKKNGTKRKYRFPKTRAENIVSSFRTVYYNARGLISIINLFDDEQCLRDYLTKKIAGFGLKQSSMFLRNIGMANKLAIVDTHVIQFLMELLNFPCNRPTTISRNLYLQIEEILIEICSALDLDLPIFDLAIWYYMRGI